MKEYWRFNKMERYMSCKSNSYLDIQYNSEGSHIGLNLSITIPYDEFTTFKLPPNCYKCPAGYCTSGECGRNVPFKQEDGTSRPETCKLKEADISFVIMSEVQKAIQNYKD